LTIDATDKLIVKYISKGIHSYNDLSKLCNIGRNTVYRRIEKLEKTGIIDKMVMAIPDFERLELSAIIIGINVKAQEVDRTADYLKKQSQVKFIWKTYGTHDLVFTMICSKGEEGTCIHSMKSALENLNIGISGFDSSTSFSWSKIDFCPYFEDESDNPVKP
jgi:DNA-binding Lrp family transcriptional regulator